MTITEKRTKLKEWVKRRNESVEPRRYDWQELWEEVKPYFEQCEGDDQFRFELMCLATNYR